MKDPMRLVDRFCYRHPSFGIRNLSKGIAIISGVVLVLGLVSTDVGGQRVPLTAFLTFNVPAILRGQLWRLVSFLFIPAGGGLLGVISVYFYYWIGSTLEQYWGTAKFNVYILFNVLFTALGGVVLYLCGVNASFTASYVFLAMFLAFAVYFPDTQVLFMYFIPVKIKFLAYVDAVFFLYDIFVSLRAGNVAGALVPVIALLGFLCFCGGELWQRRPRRPSAGTVNFRREAARIRYEQRNELYRHKCSVCGRTDTDFPELEFRYCSRCVGYHCFCAEHINSHVHFTE